MSLTVICPTQTDIGDPSQSRKARDPMGVRVGTIGAYGTAFAGGQGPYKVMAKCYWGVLSEPPEAPDPNDPDVRILTFGGGQSDWAFCGANEIRQVRCGGASPFPTNTLVIWAFYVFAPTEERLIVFRARSALEPECIEACSTSSSGSPSFWPSPAQSDFSREYPFARSAPAPGKRPKKKAAVKAVKTAKPTKRKKKR